MSTQEVTFHAKGIVFTEDSATKVRDFLGAQDSDVETAGLRVGVRGGGCSGFQYQLAFDQQRDGDVVFTDRTPAPARAVRGQREPLEARSGAARVRGVPGRAARAEARSLPARRGLVEAPAVPGGAGRPRAPRRRVPARVAAVRGVLGAAR